jgi:hypothetical protein
MLKLSIRNSNYSSECDEIDENSIVQFVSFVQFG